VLGEVIRRIRRDKGLTLQQVADITGLSVPYLSQVENDQGNPTLLSLRRIAAALETSVFSLMAQDELNEPTSVLIRAGKRTRMEVPDFQYAAYELLTSSFQSARIQAVLGELAPGGSSCEEPMSHGQWEAEEWVYVLDGQLEFTIDNRVHQLGPGDSIHFRPALPHMWRNLSETEKALIISVMAPPTF